MWWRGKRNHLIWKLFFCTLNALLWNTAFLSQVLFLKAFQTQGNSSEAHSEHSCQWEPKVIKNLAWVQVWAFLPQLPAVPGTMSVTSVTKGQVSFWAITSPPARSAVCQVDQGFFGDLSLLPRVSLSINAGLFSASAMAAEQECNRAYWAWHFYPVLAAWQHWDRDFHMELCVCTQGNQIKVDAKRNLRTSLLQDLLLFLFSARTSTKFLSAFPCIPCPFVASQNVWIFSVTLISVLISGLLLGSAEIQESKY